MEREIMRSKNLLVYGTCIIFTKHEILKVHLIGHKKNLIKMY